MKRNRHFILLLCMLVCTASKSQFSKGDRLIGGNANAGFGTQNSESPGSPTAKGHSFNINLSPRFSWVTKPNQMMGIMIGAGYSYSKYFNDGSSQSTSNSIGFSAGYFLRHYSAFSKQAGWFVEYNLNGGYSSGTNHSVYTTGGENKSKSKNYSMGAAIYPGFYYRISAGTLIEASFGGLYANYNKNKGETSSSSSFNIGASFPASLSFGVQFLLPHKQSSKS